MEKGREGHGAAQHSATQTRAHTPSPAGTAASTPSLGPGCPVCWSVQRLLPPSSSHPTFSPGCLPDPGLPCSFWKVLQSEHLEWALRSCPHSLGPVLSCGWSPRSSSSPTHPALRPAARHGGTIANVETRGCQLRPWWMLHTSPGGTAGSVPPTLSGSHIRDGETEARRGCARSPQGLQLYLSTFRGHRRRQSRQRLLLGAEVCHDGRRTAQARRPEPSRGARPLAHAPAAVPHGRPAPCQEGRPGPETHPGARPPAQGPGSCRPLGLEPPTSTSLTQGGAALVLVSVWSPVLLRRHFPHGAALFSPSPLLLALFSAPLVPSPDGTPNINSNQPQMRRTHCPEAARPRATAARAPTTRPIYKQFCLRRLSYICPDSCFIFLSKRHSFPICLAVR